MGSNNSQQKYNEHPSDQNTAQPSEAVKLKQSQTIKTASNISGSGIQFNPDLKKKEKKMVEKIIEEFKSTYPELQKDEDFNPLTMDLAISQGLHINYKRETTKINLNFTPILKKSSLLEVKLLQVEKFFWKNEYKVINYLDKKTFMTIKTTSNGYLATDLPCEYSEFELERNPDGKSRH